MEASNDKSCSCSEIPVDNASPCGCEKPVEQKGCDCHGVTDCADDTICGHTQREPAQCGCSVSEMESYGCESEAQSCGCSVSIDDLAPGVLTTYLIEEMDCPTEEALIRSKLASVAGINGMDFNLMKRTLTVKHNSLALQPITRALESLHMGAKVLEDGTESPGVENPTNWGPLVVAGILAFGSEIAHLLYDDSRIVLALALAAIAIGGLSTFKKGWIALKNLNLNMNALMSFAVTGAIIIGEFPEAAMVMVLFALAEAIEARSIKRARNAIQKLLNLSPEKATVQNEDGTWSEVETRNVEIGSRIRVKPGERIALDGTIIEGHSAINQAPITGESLPVEKKTGDTVFAGTINEAGSFEFRVTAEAGNSTLSRIIYAVEAAQGSRAPTQRFVDSFAKVYTPIVFAVALLVGVVPPLFMGGEWYTWIYKALVLLVIACPCALVISTPVSIVSGLASATRHGILVKGGMFLEQGRKLSVLALDKTGTVTYGKPKQTDFVQLGDLDSAVVVQLASSLAARSDHPISKAVADAAHQAGTAFLGVSAFTAIPGQGISGIINGEKWYLGNYRLAKSMSKEAPKVERSVSDLEADGKSVVLLIGDTRGIQGMFAVADTVKESSKEAIAALKLLGLETIMLTGDNASTAQAIAAKVGVDEVKSDMLPEDKLAAVRELTRAAKVGMVGDGINDAPALAQADIGFAMGAAGTDTAIETADVALMDDDLRKIPVFIRLSQATYSILAQNITLALGIKAVFLVLNFLDYATMWMAVFADIGTSLIVVGNGLRLLRK